jgi:chemotaxis protein CheC
MSNKTENSQSMLIEQNVAVIDTAVTELDISDLEILKEVGNIGAGHAATSLSTVLQQEVQMSIPAVCSMPPHLLNKHYNRYDMPTNAVFMQLTRDCEMDILLMIDNPEAKKIAAAMTMTPTIEELDPDMEQSAIQELANIIIGSFLSAISDFTGILLVPTPPTRIVDTFDAILDNFLVNQAVSVEKAIVFDACFSRQGEDSKSILMIFPSKELQRRLIEKSKELMGIPS